MAEEYSEENIRALSGTEAVRVRPQLYFDTCFNEKTLDALPFEAACHALDEYIDGKCTQLEIGILEDAFRLRYDAGMSLRLCDGLPMAELIMTELFACSNHKKHLEVGEEFCAIGIAAINAAAAQCELVTVSDGHAGRFRFEAGKTVSREVIADSSATRTDLWMRPDPSVFGDLQLTFSGVQQKAEALMQRLPGLTITVISC